MVRASMRYPAGMNSRKVWRWEGEMRTGMNLDTRSSAVSDAWTADVTRMAAFVLSSVLGGRRGLSWVAEREEMNERT